MLLVYSAREQLSLVIIKHGSSIDSTVSFRNTLSRISISIYILSVKIIRQYIKNEILYIGFFIFFILTFLSKIIVITI